MYPRDLCALRDPSTAAFKPKRAGCVVSSGTPDWFWASCVFAVTGAGGSGAEHVTAVVTRNWSPEEPKGVYSV